MTCHIIIFVFNIEIFLKLECQYVLRTIVAIAGKDFAVIASDNRLLTGFSILSRNVPKTIQM